MAGEAHPKTVGDYVTLVRGTTYKGALVGKPGPALLGLGSIEPGGGFRIGDYKTYGGDCPDELMLFPGDLYASLKGATKDGKMIGSVARVPPTVPTGRLTQDTVKLVFQNHDPEDRSFLYWVLRTPQYRDYCAGHAMGSAVVALSRRDFLSYSIPQPTTDRRKIVALLDAIEQRIELNRQMNETLEATARALFKSWFVDFDPVNTKAEGRDPGLPKPVADLFPVSLEESELGERPKGWGVARFADTIEIVGGGTPQTSIAEYWGGDIPWFSVVDAPRDSEVWVLDTEKKVTHAGVENSSTRVLPVGTTIISARGTVGRVALVGVPMAMNQSCYGLRGLAGTQGFFNYYATRELVARLKQHAHGSVFDTITRDTLGGVSVVVPPGKLVEYFEKRVGPILDRIRAGLLEVRTLATVRDGLLPKLISGELRVRDAENLAENAAL